jgi:hypothetical protein
MIEGVHCIHLIGIGGIGVSGVARALVALGLLRPEPTGPVELRVLTCHPALEPSALERILGCSPGRGSARAEDCAESRDVGRRPDNAYGTCSASDGNGHFRRLH